MKLILSIIISVIGSGFLVQAQLGAGIKLQKAGKIAENTPYYCLILRTNDYSGPPEFSGSIISPKHIITSKYGIQAGGTFIVGVGSNRKALLIYYNVEKLHIYERYNHGLYSFVIMELKNSLTFNTFIQPIALPPLNVHMPLLNEQGRITSMDEEGGILNESFVRVATGFTYEGMKEEGLYYVNTTVNVKTGAGLVVQYFGVDTIVGVFIQSNGLDHWHGRISAGRTWIYEQIGI